MLRIVLFFLLLIGVLGANEPAQIGIEQDFRVILTVRALTLQAQGDGFEFAMDGDRVGTAYLGSEVLAFDNTSFAFALQAGLGFHTIWDNWDLNFIYTRFHRKENKGALAKKTLIPILWFQRENLGIQDEAAKVSSRWTIKCDFVDSSLEKPYYISQKFILTPFMGFRGGILDQSFDVTANIIDQENGERKSKNHSDSWYIGPRFGVMSKWLFNCGFSLIANAGSALVYTHYKTTHHEDSIDPVMVGSTTFLQRKESASAVRNHFDLNTGFSWEHLFGDDVYATFSLYYTFQSYGAQNQMRALSTLTSGEGNLFFQGVVFSSAFDF